MTGLSVANNSLTFPFANYAKASKNEKLKLDNKQFYIHAKNETTNNLAFIEDELLSELEETSKRNNSSQKSYKYIVDFIKCLKDFKIIPIVVPEPSGLLGLEWYNKGKSFVLSIDDNGVLVYSYYSEYDGQQSGTLKFNNKIPKNLNLFIEEIAGEQ